MNVQSVALNTIEWNLEDLKHVQKNNLNVFTTFACGGGSTMGYKRAGYSVLGACDIDKTLSHVYQTNHKPPSLSYVVLHRY